MNKYLLITLLSIVVSGAMGQSKPRKVTIKKSVTISKDSTYYLPDTIACVFQELVIKPDTVYTKWQHGYVVWQVWNDSYWGGISNFGNAIYIGRSINNDPYKNDYLFTDTMSGTFLYSDHKKVTNKVINAYSK